MPPSQQDELPAAAIRGFVAATQSPESRLYQETICEALEWWSSGLLEHEHPSEPAALLTAFIDLLNNPSPQIPWGQIPESLTNFLVMKVLDHAALALTILADSSPPILLEESATSLSAADMLLSSTSRQVPPTGIGDSIFLILRLNYSNCSSTQRDVVNHFSETLCQNRSFTHIVNTNFLKAISRLSTALAYETDFPNPDALLQIHNLASATTILYNMLTNLNEKHLYRYKHSIYPLIHPLLEHVHQPTRSAGLGCLRYLHDKVGPLETSTKFLRGSLLWADAETAIQAIPLLCMHLRSDVDNDEVVKCQKRILATLKSLMTARDGRHACVKSTTAAVTLLKEPLQFGDGLVNHGEKWMRGLGEFLGKVSRMAGEGKLDETFVIDVCEAIKEGIRWCWLLADRFRGSIVDGCLIAVREIPAEVVFVAIRNVLHVLACCNPGRMGRLLRDLKETCSEYPSLTGIAEFLDTVEPLVDIKCEKVAIGGMATLFFPELNQF